MKVCVRRIKRQCLLNWKNFWRIIKMNMKLSGRHWRRQLWSQLDEEGDHYRSRGGGTIFWIGEAFLNMLSESGMKRVKWKIKLHFPWVLGYFHFSFFISDFDIFFRLNWWTSNLEVEAAAWNVKEPLFKNDFPKFPAKDIESKHQRRKGNTEVNNIFMVWVIIARLPNHIKFSFPPFQFGFPLLAIIFKGLVGVWLGIRIQITNPWKM